MMHKTAIWTRDLSEHKTKKNASIKEATYIYSERFFRRAEKLH